MSTSRFNEGDHPRSGDGRFTDKPVDEAAGGTCTLPTGVRTIPARTWPTWYPEPTGDKPIDCDSFIGDPTWIAAWNETPHEMRAPIRVYHSGSSPNAVWSGVAHFGSVHAAVQRAHNTHEDFSSDAVWLHIVDFRGDLHPEALPDSVANYAVTITPDLHSAFAGANLPDEQYEIWERESEEHGWDGDPVELREEFWNRDGTWAHPNTAIPYWNNTEGSDESVGLGSEISLAVNVDAMSSGVFRVVGSRLLDEDDYSLVW